MTLLLTRLVRNGTNIAALTKQRDPATQLLTARGEARWMREGALRAALGNTPDTSKVRAQAPKGIATLIGPNPRLQTATSRRDWLSSRTCAAPRRD